MGSQQDADGVGLYIFVEYKLYWNKQHRTIIRKH